MLEVLPSCFNSAAETGGATTSTTDATGKMSQNLVSCIYHVEIGGKMLILALTWSKTLMGQSLTVHLDRSACNIDISPSSFFFFKTRPGSKSLLIGEVQCRRRVKLFWDFSGAHYAHAAEPSSGFYLCLVCNGRMVFMLGDLHEEATRRSGAVTTPDEPALLCRREHVFGRRNYATKARFGESERSHEIRIDCSTGGSGSRCARLRVMVDGKLVLEVKHLQWKFRGNEKIFVDGSSVEIYWDVYNWLFNSDGNGHAVFMFQGGGGGRVVPQWPEFSVAGAVPGRLKGLEQRLLRKSVSSSTSSANSVLQWAESGGSSCGGSPASSGFSLLLYAWRSD